ncbi:FAD dependent oxidoreductase [Truncatella angustata]|uniref:FAD dependent oxidoreductase n=1 Tax=Truncatella angustata TaxID=152316 RepID=A0A9P8ZVH1_9PEZI|nr:FAD dependent oxidoreductase [Truncatella angustata]KAH6648759.1 FAD dependent oxidoreductase [Truncatella angustata]
MSATVVLGSGIIGVSTAYYLSKHQPPSSIHLVEPSPELFASASGYAGGFLAKDWFQAASASLGALSFDEHRKLAEKGDGASRWGYTKSTSISLSPGPKDGNRVDAWSREGTSRTEAAGGDRKECVAPPWLRRGEGDTVDMIGEEGTVAQVDPLRLSQSLLSKCVGIGVHLHHPARATSVQTDMRNEVSSIRIEDATSGTETDVPCTTIIITAGAWSPQVFKTLFPTSNLNIPLSSLAGYSLVVKSPHWVKEHDEHGCHAIFMASQSGYSPEVFSRIGGHIYIAGLNSATEPLPPLATDSKGKISKSAIEQLLATAREVIGQGEEEHDLEIVKEGLCFRPVTTSGLPIIGRIPDNALGAGMATRPGADGGVYLAAGHGPWGISLCLGTGKVLAEMVQGRSLSADVSRLGLNGY